MILNGPVTREPGTLMSLNRPCRLRRNPVVVSALLVVVEADDLAAIVDVDGLVAEPVVARSRGIIDDGEAALRLRTK